MNTKETILRNSEQNRVIFTLDLYSKVILSVIAFTLLLITCHLYFSPSDLNAVQSVQDVNIKYINGSSLWGSELPVNLKQLNGRSFNDEIPVDIKSIRGSQLWNQNIPVDIHLVNGNTIYGSEVPVKVK